MPNLGQDQTTTCNFFKNAEKITMKGSSANFRSPHTVPSDGILSVKNARAWVSKDFI